MKIVNTGSTYQIYGDDLKVYDSLPARTYNVRFNKMTGFFLEERPNLEVTEKVYGRHLSKASKVLKTFNHSERNVGVILSGKKGIGKSLCGRLIAIEAINDGLPVIIVDGFIPGIASFIESIEQPIMVFFDEFDKTFGNINVGNNETDAQSSMLSLFDGLSNGKKLFVVTCNNLNRLSDYFVNRPGRFHYHFRFDRPSDEEVTAYLSDQLNPEYQSEISSIVAFSHRVPLNFDCLRAIAFELNLGSTFREALEDLNIVNTENHHYDITIYTENGDTLTCNNVVVDLYSTTEFLADFIHPRLGSVAELRINPKYIFYDEDKQEHVIVPEAISTHWLDEDYKEQIGATPVFVSGKIEHHKDAMFHYAV